MHFERGKYCLRGETSGFRRMNSPEFSPRGAPAMKDPSRKNIPACGCACGGTQRFPNEKAPSFWHGGMGRPATRNVPVMQTTSRPFFPVACAALRSRRRCVLHRSIQAGQAFNIGEILPPFQGLYSKRPYTRRAVVAGLIGKLERLLS